jgi:hypothetical protein
MGRTSRLNLPFPSRTEWMLTTLGLTNPVSPHSSTMVQRYHPPKQKVLSRSCLLIGLGKLAISVVSCGQGGILWRAIFLATHTSLQYFLPSLTITLQLKRKWLRTLGLMVQTWCTGLLCCSPRKNPRFVTKCIYCARWFKKDLALLYNFHLMAP